MADRTVVVLGGGTGGLVAAHRLRRRLDPADRVVVIDRTPTFQFAPSFLWVMTGARRAAQISADRRRLRRAGIEILLADALEIDPARHRITTTETEVRFDQLILALGAELAPDALDGFSAAAHNIYTLEGATAAADALARFDGGRVAVVVSRLPYKCPAAPYETAFLTEALLRHRGVRDRTTIDIYTPEPFPMPTAGPVLGQALAAMLAERGINLHPETSIERIDPHTGQLALAGSDHADYDLLLGIPPHHAPEVARTSGLAAETGFVPVDPATLATAADGVYAIGDITAIPIAGGKFLPKAGVFAEAHADVVATNIAAELTGRPAGATFDGSGACFVELGDGRAAFATGNFYAPDGPQIRPRFAAPVATWPAAVSSTPAAAPAASAPPSPTTTPRWSASTPIPPRSTWRAPEPPAAAPEPPSSTFPSRTARSITRSPSPCSSSSPTPPPPSLSSRASPATVAAS